MQRDLKQDIIDLLKGTKREGIDNLIQVMEDGGFFKAPASTKYHLCKEEGLAEHTLNVYNILMRLNDSLCAGIPHDSIIITSILHDLGKMGDHGKENYVINMIKDGRPTKAEPEQKYKQSEAEPYKSNKKLTYEEHEVRSALIAERYIFLSEEEETAIIHHNGLWGKLDSSFGNANYCSSKLAFLLHTADMYCSRFTEVEEKGETKDGE